MKNRKHARRVKRLALICTLSTIILVVSTYAWFIGMKTVNVSTFDVQIAATKGLYLSLDGVTWSETVNIDKSNFDSTYSGNTNTWSDGGLIPMSTVGEISSTDSRLILFEKGSLTTTDGGYRLMTSKVDNTLATRGTNHEGKGFVAFDLFVKNLSGNEYYTDYNQLNEEAIYLTQASSVVVDETAGSKQDKTGIENSVRVAFAQIARVEADVTDATNVIQKMTCAGGTLADETVTGICDRYAQIWEPNDTKHVENAINWYSTACLKRTGTAGSGFAYGTDKCSTIENNKYYQTYTVGNVIDYSNYVDVYDGTEYNTYTSSISTTKVNGNSTIANGPTGTVINSVSGLNEGKLYNYDYFTDSEKMLTGMDRPTFMTLAPNSITKVRVYVYIEGQDVDNYDFASLGKQIKVNFGFTKERFYAGDIQYDGPMSGENGVIPSTPETAAVAE